MDIVKVLQSVIVAQETGYKDVMDKSVSLTQLFLIFFKMGAFTIGGGYAMIPLIEKELTKREWISEEDLQDIVVLTQSAPGLLAVNMAIYSGYRLAGLKGSIVASVGAVLPSFVIILAIAMAFTSFKDNKVIASIFQGVRPVAVALILVPAANMAKSGCKTWWAWLVAAATLFAVAFMKVSPIWIILVTIFVASGIAISSKRRK